MRIAFAAAEYQADGSIRPAAYAYAGMPAEGWAIEREGREHLRLGPGYRLVRVSHCGVCATDLARRHLPFPLPQLTGHEVVGIDEAGAPVVIEINASHAARALPRSAWCAFCRGGLATHCPDRLVLGIHDLPGGFAPWVLAPEASIVPVPRSVTSLSAMLAEPFAAALRAVETLALGDGDRVAVLGPRRLGTLVVAALAASRRQTGRKIEILALARRPALRALALEAGADEAIDPALVGDKAIADVVVDTTGDPRGLAQAFALARREVHLKSTTGAPALGLSHPTELVVDELTVVPFARLELPVDARVAAVVGRLPAGIAAELGRRGLAVVAGDDPGALADAMRAGSIAPFGAADVAVVD